jgi:uncharacterized SAM-binding protein YcdF (DUF218 family)
LTTRQTWFVVIGLVGLGLFAALTAALVVWPYEQAAQPADAVAVLGASSRGGSDRLPAALRLVDSGIADTLVVLTPPEDGSLCHDSAPYEIICINPRPFNTRGEAEALGRLARSRSWRKLTVVTSSYHVTRARLLLARCFHGSLVVVGSKGTGIPVGPWRALHELGGLAYAIVRPSC